MTMLDKSKFRKASNGNEWLLDFVISDDEDLEVILSDIDGQPDEKTFETACQVIERITEIKKLSVDLLSESIKENGDWWLNVLNLGIEPENNTGQFSIQLGFESNESPHKYMYTDFKVIFSMSDENKFSPLRTSIGHC
jgi:hypothetical protein